jgi:FkbM family methyltransferase
MATLLARLTTLTRRSRFAHWKIAGRVARRMALMISRRLSPAEIKYHDTNGYVRVANPSDHLELVGLIGAAEPLPRRAVKHVRPGDWVIDVGANVGNVTATLCRLVESDGLVWAIEPIPRNVKRLTELRDLNDLRQLEVLEGALASVNGRSEIRLPKSGHSGWASFTKSWDIGRTLEVVTWRLDDLVAAAPKDRRIVFVKIDVEGFELDVLRGAAETLRTHRPLVFCEFNNILLKDAGHSSYELLNAFQNLGYVIAGRSKSRNPRLDERLEDLLMLPT